MLCEHVRAGVGKNAYFRCLRATPIRTFTLQPRPLGMHRPDPAKSTSCLLTHPPTHPTHQPAARPSRAGTVTLPAVAMGLTVGQQAAACRRLLGSG